MYIYEVILYEIIIYSNGSGRTGTFISIYIALEQITTDGIVDIFLTVKSCRQQRANFVANSVSGKSYNVIITSAFTV